MPSPYLKSAQPGDAASAPRAGAGPRLSPARGEGPRWGLSRTGAGFTFLLCGLYATLCTQFPIWHTDLWGHLAYGREIWVSGRLPATEPLMPLARDVPFVDTAWLSQLAGYGLYSWLGVAGLKLVYAVPITAVFAVLAIVVHRQTRSTVCTAVALAMFAWINYQPLQIVRPQLAGLLCFTLLYAWLAPGRWRGWYWWAAPILFGAWANLHGSFPVGLMLIALLMLGRAIDILFHTGRIGCVVADRHARRLLIMLALAAAATCLNPYGPRVYDEVLHVARNPNLRDLVEWRPLTIQMPHGLAAAVSAILLFVAYRLSYRRVRASEVLLLSVLGLLALVHSRMLVWWGVVAADCFARHLSGAWRRGRPVAARTPVRRPAWALTSIAAALACLVLTPPGTLLVPGRATGPSTLADELRRSASSLTPLDAVAFLHEHPRRGLIFNTYEWGDYLLWAGPRDADVFVASHAHLVPRTVWLDYLRVSRGAAPWNEVLDRYGVNTVFVDRAGRGALIRLLRHDPEWDAIYEDRMAVVFVRRVTPAAVPTPPRAPGPDSS